MSKKLGRIAILILPYVLLATLISFWGGVAALIMSLVVVFAVSFLRDKFPLLLFYMALAAAVVVAVSAACPNGFWGHLNGAADLIIISVSGGLLFVGAVFSLALWMSIDPIMTLAAQLDEAHWTDALNYMLAFLFHTRQPWIVVDDGKITAEKPAGAMKRFGGPGVLVVNQGNVVVTMRRGNVSQVVGHGVYRLHRLEKIKKVVDVSPQWKTFWAEDVLTGDGIPLKVKLGVGFRIMPCDRDARNSLPRCGDNVSEHIDALMTGINRDAPAWDCCVDGSFPVKASDVLKAVFRPASNDWTVAPSIVSTALVSVMGRYSLDDLLGVVAGGVDGAALSSSSPEAGQEEARLAAQGETGTASDEEVQPSTRRKGGQPSAGREETQPILARIAESCKEQSMRAFESWGLQLTTVRVYSIAMPSELRDSWFSHWTTVREAEAEMASMQRRAKGASSQIKLVASARQDAFKQMAEAFDKAIEKLAARAEQGKDVAEMMNFMTLISGRLAAGDVIAYRYLHILENIAKSGGDKVFLIGGEDRELLEAIFRSRE